MIKLRNKRWGCYCRSTAKVMATIVALLFVGQAYALTAGTVATTVTGTFTAIAKLIVASAYVAGLGFAIGAIMKFKQHKDNPTQIPIGTPIALIFIAAALVFLPTIFGVTGATLFGTATVGGATGTLIGDI